MRRVQPDEKPSPQRKVVKSLASCLLEAVCHSTLNVGATNGLGRNVARFMDATLIA